MIQNIVATAVTCQHLGQHYNFDIAACKFPNLTLVLQRFTSLFVSFFESSLYVCVYIYG